METAVALGSNLGDRAAHLRAGITFLEGLSRDGRAEVSPFYETVPMGCPPGSGAFLNAVAIIDSGLAPEALLARMLEFERALGRPERRARNAPRPLDLDLLYCGDMIRDTAALALPHPRLASRRFVLQPLCDLRPGRVLPGQERTVRELLAALPEEGILRCDPSHR